ncbi:MAG: cysteine hydrolase family protein [Paludibacter sp.]|nr:cysteine hydrolase family protein [Paludibacter sp.]
MKTALLLIDIQNDYFEQGTMTLVGSEQAAANAGLVLGRARAQGLPVIHIQHIATRPTATFFLPDTAGAEIHAAVKPLPSEKVIVKHYPNSFRETDLLEYLKTNGIEDLVVCGMMTHMCVDATVRAAKDYGYTCTLIGDACATKDLEIKGESVRAKDVQNGFLAALEYYYAAVKTTAEYLTGK